MTQQTERDALRKLAEAATPGPWAFGTFHRLLVVQVDKHGYADKHSAIADIGAGSIPWDATADSMQEYNDAEYIAAANPAAVITLLDQLQSQAERIKELESEVEMWKATANAVVDFEKVQLRAEIAAIAATEPVLVVEKEPDYWSGGHFHEGSKPHIKPTKVWCLPIGTQLFTRHMPAQDVNAEPVEGLNRSYTEQLINALHENSDPVSIDAAEEFQRLLAA